MARMTVNAGLAAALLTAAALTALGSTDVLACRRSNKTLSATEQAKAEEQFKAHRKAVQARNIREIEKALVRSKISAPNRSKVKELRDEAAKLSGAGRLDDADRALGEAWKLLGHPELFVVTALVQC